MERNLQSSRGIKKVKKIILAQYELHKNPITKNMTPLKVRKIGVENKYSQSEGSRRISQYPAHSQKQNDFGKLDPKSSTSRGTDGFDRAVSQPSGAIQKIHNRFSAPAG